MNIVLSYKMLLKPNKQQVALLEDTLFYLRRLHNHLLDWKIRMYKNHNYPVYKGEMENYSKFLATTDEFSFLKKVHSHPVQGVSERLDKSFKAFFNKTAGFPKFKSDKFFNSFEFKQPKSMNLFKEEGFISISKIGDIPFINHQKIDWMSLNKKPSLRRMTIKRENDKWYVILIMEEDIKIDNVSLDQNNEVGCDVGLKSFIAFSDGTFKANPRYLKKSEDKLKRLQKELSRKKKGSQNREKVRKRLAKLHLKIRNQRKDFFHKVALALVKKYDFLVFEDLRIKNMMKNHKLAKSISDASWAMFLNILEYKAQKFGKHFEKVNPRGTSQTCICGASVPKELKDRHHECPVCGIKEDRDTHSAKVILSRASYKQKTA